MQYITAAVLTLASAAIASPIAARDTTDQPFGLLSIHSGDENVHLRPINAASHAFYIGKATSTFCPSTIPNCPAGNLTQIEVSTGSVFMDAEVAGGQQAYIAPDGALAYTIAHSSLIPEGSTTGPFTATAATPNGTVGTFKGPSGATFAACPCPGEAGVYQIYDSSAAGFTQEGCTGIAIASTPPAEGPVAWQYN